MQFIVGAATAPRVGVAGAATALPMALTIAVPGVGGVRSATVPARTGSFAGALSAR